MLEEILNKESVDEKDIAILNSNLHLLSHEDKVRFGFEIAQEVEEAIVEELDSPIAKYKVIGVIPILDQEGNKNGFLEEGSIQEVPELLGDSWVEEGLAEKFVEEVKVETEKPKRGRAPKKA